MQGFKMSEEKSNPHCPHCDFLNTPDINPGSVICVQCGKDMSNICAKCGTVLFSSTEECPKCGYLNKTKEKGTKTEVTTDGYIGEDSGKECPKCGSTLRRSRSYRDIYWCIKCDYSQVGFTSRMRHFIAFRLTR